MTGSVPESKSLGQNGTSAGKAVKTRQLKGHEGRAIVFLFMNAHLVVMFVLFWESIEPPVADLALDGP